MIEHAITIKLILSLHTQGLTILQIAKTLNLHIEEVSNIIHAHS